MDIATMGQLLSTVGFPIFITLVLMWYIRDLTEKHRTETKEFTEALNNNTQALQRLADRLDEEGNDEKVRTTTKSGNR